MKKVLIASIVMSGIMSSASAYAGGYVAPVIDVPPAVAQLETIDPTWGGFYLGANLNYGKGKAKAVDHFADKLTRLGYGTALSKPDGTSGALRVGHDWQRGRAVFGLGAEYNFGAYKGAISPEHSAYYGMNIDVKVKNTATVFARAGYLVNDKVLAYGLVGYSAAKAHLTAPDNGGATIAKENVSGLTVGLGGEYRFSQNWSSYAEITHTDFGKIKNISDTTKLDLQQVKLGVNYRF